MKNYVVIGGQYDAYCYGSSDSLHGAKMIASRSLEHWDNWQGWHYPDIYRAEDVTPVSNFYGDGYAPKCGAVPVAVREYGGQWESTEGGIYW